MKKLLLLLFLSALVGGGISYSLLHQSIGPLEHDVFVEIPRGSSTLRIGELLESAALLRSPLQAALWRGFHPRATLQAGEYLFRREGNVDAVLTKIARGEIYYRELTIPEGSSMYDIAKLVEDQQFFSAAAFLAVAQDPAPIRDLDPLAPSLEGYLYPSTYRLPRKLTPQALCLRLTRQFREVWKSLHAGPPHAAVTLASLVEKESARPDERPRIAGLFFNRLRQKMKLECDPTVIYAALVEDRYRGKIYRSDLDNESPYNTYRHTGLPPGPIANPGLQSLKAALEPAETDAIFFVAEPGATGRHVFTSTLAAHNRAVADYRRGEKR